MEDELHIPWTNDALEKLVRDIINTGEATKVDFKASLTLGSAAERAEFAKDVQAFANSYDHAYRNHGFVVLGAAPGKLSYTTFAQDADRTQATVDQILREHLGPFIPTQVRLFGAGTAAWGVVVVPPSRNAPHVFVRDTEKFKRGDIFVRAGSTTSKAEPADFARFYRIQLDDHTREMRDQVRDLQRDVAALKKRRPRAAASSVQPAPAPTAAPAVAAEPEADLISIIDRSLAKATDPVAGGLQEHAEAIRTFLDSKDVPWDLNHITKETGRAVVAKLEAVAGTFWEALAHIVEHDDAGRYDDAVLDALSKLAFDPQPPSGTSYTQFGTGVRLYPLVVSLYVVFMIGMRKKRVTLLKRVLELSLARRSYYEDPLPLGNAPFIVRRADEVFQTMRDDYPNQRWCDGVGSYVERWLSANLFSTMPSLDRNREYFYVAEFAVSLLSAASSNIARPAHGMFYYISDSAPVIARFLKSDSSTMKSVFGTGLRDALVAFDTWGSKIANSGRCFGDGFQGGSADLVFPPPKAAKG